MFTGTSVLFFAVFAYTGVPMHPIFYLTTALSLIGKNIVMESRQDSEEKA